MSETEIVHYFKPNCARGFHNWKVVFKSHDKRLSWVKICRRCDTIKSVTGSFNEDGQWIKGNQLDYRKAPGEPRRDSGEGSEEGNGNV